MMPSATVTKTIVLDSGPLITNSTLPHAKSYFTTAGVLAELKDVNVRSRIDNFLNLQIRSPSKTSLDFVRNFAKKTGDIEVLSHTDLSIIALTYELECEQNSGDWKLKETPGQADQNGPRPGETVTDDRRTEVEEELLDVALADAHPARQEESNDCNSENSDTDGWITPVNIKQKQATESVSQGQLISSPNEAVVACATHDFAMQNVLLQIGLDLVSDDGRRISIVKTWILRCHACFKTTRKMSQKFCPSCGGPTLLRTAVSTSANGEMKIHLKRNMQWNNRGTIYSIPNQKAGTANMKGVNNLILRADQREVEKIQKRDKYKKTMDLLDPDYIPSIVSGHRDLSTQGFRVGHGRRNPNSNNRK